MRKRKKIEDKYYTHLDIKKKYSSYEKKLCNPDWVKKHGFYPFIHYQIIFNKYILNIEGHKEKKQKIREIYYSAHVDRFIYQYYAQLINDKYNTYTIDKGINAVSTAYRNNKKGKCNIHFAKEVLEFLCKKEEAFVFVGDFTSFFDNLEHEYLKKRLQQVLGVEKLLDDYYQVYKNITRFTYVELVDIESFKNKKRKDMRRLEKYFETSEFQKFKKENLKRHMENYGIPQGSSISAVLANVYMTEFDKKINDYVTSNNGLYRRYCDDIIIIIPMTQQLLSEQKHLLHIQKIDNITKSVPRLELNLDKTEQYFYDANAERKLIDVKGSKNCLSYLGFSFDGQYVRIREKSLFKYYCRAYKKVKTVKKHKGQKDEYVIKKSLYKLYTHLGDKKYPGKNGNFITYANKAHSIFKDSDCLESKIYSQIKKHWNKINKRLNEPQPQNESENMNSRVNI